MKQGVETLDTFEAALDAEPDRIAGEVERMERDPSYVSWNHLNFAYTDQSLYAASLERWFEQWPREQMLVLRSEDLYADPAAVLERSRAALGLDLATRPGTMEVIATDVWESWLVRQLTPIPAARQTESSPSISRPTQNG